MPSNAINGFGYFGKVPARGDFIQSHLPSDFVAGWSEWLQAVIAVSREQLGEQWLDRYLTSPIWHFALSPGVCGESAMAGTLMPSVDQVGRHFYFTMAKPISQPPVNAWQQREWSELSEQKVLKLLDDDTDVVRWAESVADVDWLDAIKPANRLVNHAKQSQQLVLESEQFISPEHLLHQQLRKRLERYCIWWTAGSEFVPECSLVTESLPLVSQFSAMLDGQWEQWGW
ncbi:type VI secretion system-associated protein TagF [Agarivorans sp. 1_MG-2023]|uniref:type VI secretion system-associated protein TagF n=1 Tax=Agarivorans sp. 1_MG-2023 TaxID=3062634 RepID=UPI0026E38324|nr:type VI secretion system-associated protein TagF [Agarivorans sp. 1_MG-2023]MDO6764933.1 type VI secretion system-associated protein TagF [Agarivorans sp. 1_MG-2023]